MTAALADPRALPGARPAGWRERVTVIDAGVGNLGNLARALAAAAGVRATAAAGQGAPLEVEVTADPERVASARCLVLPGVGAFAPPRERLRGALEAALRGALADGAWLLGICVGYQLLFESGEEFGDTDGLGLLPGRITRLPAGVPLPHIGWNRLEPAGGGHPLLAGLPRPAWVYFVHSFAPDGVPEELVLARTLHGRAFPAVAGRGRVLGAQFHPEKSGRTGLALLANYLEMAHGPAAGD